VWGRDVRGNRATQTDRSKPAVLKYFSRFQATSVVETVGDSASLSIRFRAARTDGIIVTMVKRVSPRSESPDSPLMFSFYEAADG